LAQVTWTPDARDDLAAIHKDIAQDSPSAAAAFVLRLVGSVARLSGFPESGRVVPEFGVKSLRELIVGSYRVVYRLRGEDIEIIRIRHGARLLSVTDLSPP
jgi:toxin ParE1/3/4